MRTAFRFLYGLIALLSAITAAFKPLPTAHIWTKVALMPVLYYGWGMRLPRAFKGGILFAWIGDICLLFPEEEGFFLSGMGSFALMWMAYGWGWFCLPHQVWGAAYGVLVGLALMTGGALIAILWPGLRLPFTIFVPVYAAIMIGAGLAGLRKPDTWLWLGLVSFWISDTLIAYAKFVQAILWEGFWVMGLYTLAQGLLISRTARLYQRP